MREAELHIEAPGQLSMRRDTEKLLARSSCSPGLGTGVLAQCFSRGLQLAKDQGSQCYPVEYRIKNTKVTPRNLHNERKNIKEKKEQKIIVYFNSICMHIYIHIYLYIYMHTVLK